MSDIAKDYCKEHERYILVGDLNTNKTLVWTDYSFIEDRSHEETCCDNEAGFIYRFDRVFLDDWTNALPSVDTIDTVTLDYMEDYSDHRAVYSTIKVNE